MRRMQRESWRVRFSFREGNERRCGQWQSATILELPPSALYWNEEVLRASTDNSGWQIVAPANQGACKGQPYAKTTIT